ncbi:Glycosyltransferase involved in cell wall bisynthesis [Catalinimonas alkaloidigena]|uniref:Glycosyltransferase involved in cell wall bisynthesis n=1 Tax=Catalinimonas alkaloidigena TaxID=1075417 RepID=A0A1G9J3S9_9BACT|nr:glycosyltransferase family 2 protein [Catalinimonas alkaloidigena]SDL31982.1 Glycosyltransferase involved in cell wall bisynthesis [Catalinimonas alkaloidigena]
MGVVKGYLPKITIITIAYNAVDSIEATIQSVIEQKYPNYEYIIIDGGSTDGSTDIIRKYENNIDYWRSEPDEGIYDAMNKGIAKASGHWINFMNSGDTFCSSQVLESIPWGEYESYAIIYGNSMYKGNNDHIRLPLPLKALEYGIMMGNHQSMFFNKRILQKQLTYDTKYKIYADYELVNRIYQTKRYGFKYIDTLVAVYEGNGISTQRSARVRKEKYRLIFNNYGYIRAISCFVDRIINGTSLERFKDVI